MRRVSSILCFLCPVLCGCATSYNPATQRQEALLIDTDREAQMGEALTKRVEEEYPPIKDPVLLERLDRISQKIVAVAERKNLWYRFSIIEEEEPNAFALPGGPIYVTTGLMKLVQADDELAAVLGHEVGHLTAKHIVKRIQGALGAQLLQLLAVAGSQGDPRTRAGLDLAFASIFTAYSQEDELEADRLSVRYLKEAGYRPLAAVDFLTRLKEHTFKSPSRRFSYFRSHPYFSDRIRVVRQEATGQIQFDDYINLSD